MHDHPGRPAQRDRRARRRPPGRHRAAPGRRHRREHGRRRAGARAIASRSSSAGSASGLANELRLTQGYARTLVAREAHVEQGLIGTADHRPGTFERNDRRPAARRRSRRGQRSRPLLDWRGALAFGAAMGVAGAAPPPLTARAGRSDPGPGDRGPSAILVHPSNAAQEPTPRDRPIGARPRDRRPRGRRDRRAGHDRSGTAPRSGAAHGSAPTASSDATSFIDEGVVIGDRVKIQNGALVYHGVTVEDGVFIGPGAILTNDRLPARHHLDRRPRPCRRLDRQPDPPRRRARRSAPARSSSPAATSGRSPWSAPVPSSRRRSPAHALVAGNPARRIGWVCACGAPPGRLDRSRRAADVERYAATRDLSCPACGRRYSTSPTTSRCASVPRPSSHKEPAHDPDRAPGHRSRGGRGRHRRSCAAACSPGGKRVVELEERWADVHRRPARDRGRATAPSP